MNYLRNAWYAAAFDHEVTSAPLARTLLDQPVVLYRDEAGNPVALEDRCPHRFAPLSRGKLIQGVIQCAYHGLRFGTTGACVHNPHGPIPKAARVDFYPLLERYGLVWIWMGPPDAVDASTLPDFKVIADHKNYAVVKGYLHLNVNYELVNDNLLDLSHAQFLHPLLGNADSNERNRFQMKQEGHTVWAYNDMPGEPLTKLFQMMWRSSTTVGDRRAHMRWDPPSNLLLDVGFTACGRPASEGPSMSSAHLLTPETAGSTHYFWAAARDSLRDDATLSETIRVGIDAAFRFEDDPMITACRSRMGTDDLMSLNPVFLRTDAAAGLARRTLALLITKELEARRTESFPP